jgi:hypothetical protein
MSQRLRTGDKFGGIKINYTYLVFDLFVCFSLYKTIAMLCSVIRYTNDVITLLYKHHAVTHKPWRLLGHFLLRYDVMLCINK